MECFEPEGMKFESDARKKGQGFHGTKNKFSFCSRTSFAWRNSEILVYFLLNKYHALQCVCVRYYLMWREPGQKWLFKGCS